MNKKIMDRLDEELAFFHQRLKKSDLATLPDFEDLVTRGRPTHKPGYLRIAASLVLIGVFYWGFLMITRKKEPEYNLVQVTQSLLNPPEYLWHWNSPTRSLLVNKQTKIQTNQK